MPRSGSIFAASVRSRIVRRWWAARPRVKVVKNKVAPPFRVVEFDIMYGEGVSKTGELVDLGAAAGVGRSRGPVLL